MDENYYVCKEFNSSLYIKLAKAGFISTSATLSKKEKYLLPEIQFNYAVLDFLDLHINKKVQKLLDKQEYIFNKVINIKKLIDKINNYHEDSWINDKYEIMLLELSTNQYDNFELFGFELIDKKTNNLIAGEIGYKIGKTYTSLTGFFNREKKYNNYGKLQLVLLSKYLEKNHYDFWNLGHACLQYKIDLGAKVLKRDEFLKRWLTSTRNCEI